MSELIFLALGIFLGVMSAYTYVTESQWVQGQEVCKNNGGLNSFRASPFEDRKVSCVNGDRFTLKESTLKEKE